MPSLDFGEKAPFESGGMNFYRLKTKNQKFHFRFLGGPVYDGKHFFEKETGKGWDISYCPRIMKGEKCEYCEKFFEAKREMKELEQAFGGKDNLPKEEKKVFKTLEEVAKKYSVNISFHYPVLNREEEDVGIFQTTLGVRNQLDEEHDAGFPVLDFDYFVTRTEKPGSYYKLDRLDSSMMKPFTDREQEAISRAEKWDLEKIVIGKLSSQDFTTEEEAVAAAEKEAKEEEEEVDIDEILNGTTFDEVAEEEKE